MTISEYYLRLEAYQLRKVEERTNLALQAFFNQMVQTPKSKSNPHPKYDQLDKLYDAEAEISEIRHQFEGLPSKKSEKQERSRMIAERYAAYQKIKERRKQNGGKL
jgi:hypothetical protein